jgi:propionate CoA-transferase
MEVEGKEYLFYKSRPVDVAIIRGTTADEFGNITIEKEAVQMEIFHIAQAARASGGIVIAQVERLASRGTLHPQHVIVPGVIVDYIVVAKPENHWQTMATPYNPAYSGEIRVPVDSLPRMELDERKVIAKRAAMLLTPKASVNLGVGVPEGVANVAVEEGVADQLTLSIEAGTIGGIPAPGLNIGASTNPDAIISQLHQFDYYDGGGLDITYLGLAEVDQYGNLNVSKFSGRVVGPGGFINISQSAKKVAFCGSFTAGGLKTEIKNGRLIIVKEGRSKKFKSNVEQITFSGQYAIESGQQVLYITERAIFQLAKEGLVLIEIAPGVDLEKDVLSQMEFRPVISPDLKLMNEILFRDEPLNLTL